MSDNNQKNFIIKILNEFQSGNKPKAFRKLKNYLTDNPSDDIARFNFAIMCTETNKIDLAIENYKQVIKKNNNHWESRFNLYIIYLDRQLYNEAHKYVDEVLIFNDDEKKSFNSILVTNLKIKLYTVEKNLVTLLSFLTSLLPLTRSPSLFIISNILSFILYKVITNKI